MYAPLTSSLKARGNLRETRGRERIRSMKMEDGGRENEGMEDTAVRCEESERDWVYGIGVVDGGSRGERRREGREREYA
jgi:hypothetical protein